MVVMEEAAMRLRNLTRKILCAAVMLNTLVDISEAESGTMRLQRQSVDLTEVVARAVDRLVKHYSVESCGFVRDS